MTQRRAPFLMNDLAAKLSDKQKGETDRMKKGECGMKKKANKSAQGH
jgi:hypothetical protein